MNHGLYVHPLRLERANKISTHDVYVDETLGPDDWYIVSAAGEVVSSMTFEAPIRLEE